MAERHALAISSVVAVLALVGGTVAGILLLSSSASATCNPTGSFTGSIDPTAVPTAEVAGYSGEQLVNAAWVVKAGIDLGLSSRDITIGVMTAMGESSLRVLDHGDVAGPDSRGLFQQRDSWGTLAERMDPYQSAGLFFSALAAISDRDSLAPTIAAHRVQRNADPQHYAPYWDAAVAVVNAVTGTTSGLTAGGGAQVCNLSTGSSTQVTADGWAAPGAGPITSAFGMRINPVTGVYKLHAGVDLQAGGCDGPIYAAHAGVVIAAGIDSTGTGVVSIDHGGGITTDYLHEWASGILVTVGDHIEAGQQIGRVGSSGNSTGCHLHFQVDVNGQPVDPEAFMAAVGITLGG